MPRPVRSRSRKCKSVPSCFICLAHAAPCVVARGRRNRLVVCSRPGCRQLVANSSDAQCDGLRLAGSVDAVTCAREVVQQCSFRSHALPVEPCAFAGDLGAHAEYLQLTTTSTMQGRLRVNVHASLEPFLLLLRFCGQKLRVMGLLASYSRFCRRRGQTFIEPRVLTHSGRELYATSHRTRAVYFVVPCLWLSCAACHVPSALSMYMPSGPICATECRSRAVCMLKGMRKRGVGDDSAAVRAQPKTYRTSPQYVHVAKAFSEDLRLMLHVSSGIPGASRR